MITRVNRFANVEELGVLGQSVAVEQDLFRAALTLRPAIEWMLAAFAVTLEIGERPIRPGRASVIFLDAASHFRDKRLAQALERGQHAVAICVLRFKQRLYVGGQGLRIAQYFAPVFSRQPNVWVFERAAVKMT